MSIFFTLPPHRVHESVDMIQCFDQQIQSTSEENHPKAIQPNDLEWDTEETTSSTEMTSSEISVPEPIAGGHHDEEEEYKYDCLQLKDRLTEIDGILGSPDRDFSADRYVYPPPSLPPQLMV
jgi:hypothetical protein